MPRRCSVSSAVYGPRRGRAANRHLASGPELNTGPQPVVPGSPFGSTPAETFVRVGPRVRIRFPPALSPLRTSFAGKSQTGAPFIRSPPWAQAQKQFEAVFGAERTIDLRALLHAVAATDLGINAVSSEE
jgi:hypothetical protein